MHSRIIHQTRPLAQLINDPSITCAEEHPYIKKQLDPEMSRRQGFNQERPPTKCQTYHTKNLFYFILFFHFGLLIIQEVGNKMPHCFNAMSYLLSRDESTAGL